MKQLCSFLSGIIYSLSIVFLISCSLSSTKEKPPIFSSDVNNINQSIKSIANATEVRFSGAETKANGIINSELTIRLINVSNLPSDDTKLKEIGKQIGKIVSHSLKDINSYNIYKVLFVIEEFNGAIKKSSYTGYVYKIEDFL